MECRAYCRAAASSRTLSTRIPGCALTSRGTSGVLSRQPHGKILLISTKSRMIWIQGTFPRILCCGNHRGEPTAFSHHSLEGISRLGCLPPPRVTRALALCRCVVFAEHVDCLLPPLFFFSHLILRCPSSNLSDPRLVPLACRPVCVSASPYPPPRGTSS